MLDYFNFRSYSLNLYKIIGKNMNAFSTDDDGNINIEDQNSETKFKLNNITSSFIANCSGIILIYIIMVIFIIIVKKLNS